MENLLPRRSNLFKRIYFIAVLDIGNFILLPAFCRRFEMASHIHKKKLIFFPWKHEVNVGPGEAKELPKNCQTSEGLPLNLHEKCTAYQTQVALISEIYIYWRQFKGLWKMRAIIRENSTFDNTNIWGISLGKNCSIDQRRRERKRAKKIQLRFPVMFRRFLLWLAGDDGCLIIDDIFVSWKQKKMLK